jgi:hypothetical protein
VKKALIRVPVRRRPQEFIRVHPGEDCRLDTAIIDLRDDAKPTPLFRPLLFHAPSSADCRVGTAGFG